MLNTINEGQSQGLCREVDLPIGTFTFQGGKLLDSLGRIVTDPSIRRQAEDGVRAQLARGVPPSSRRGSRG